MALSGDGRRHASGYVPWAAVIRHTSLAVCRRKRLVVLCSDCENDDVILPRCLFPVVWLLLAHTGAAQSPAPVMQTILSLEKQTDHTQTMRVRGVVTGMEAGRFFLQDSTGAMSVLRIADTPAIRPGDICEVTGALVPQKTGLEMMPSAVVLTGKGDLPPAMVMNAEQLQNGAARYQRVKLSGHVHEVGNIAGSTIVSLHSAGVSLVLLWPSTKAAVKPPLELLDALVEVEGVAPPPLSSSALPGAVRLFLADASHLHVKKPGSVDPFTRPLRELSSMRDRRSETGERFLMRGIVSYWSDAGWFYFQDETGSARGNSGTFLPMTTGWPYRSSGSNPALKPGDQIELVGARKLGSGPMPYLIHCEWRVVGHGDAPVFKQTTPQQVLAADREGYPVSIDGRVTGMQFERDNMGFINHVLWVDSGGMSCRILIQKKKGYAMPVKVGDHVRVLGTVSFTYPSGGNKTAFRVNVNDFTDIQRTASPPVWQEPAIMRWLLLIAAIILFAIVWIFILRQQVKAQTARLQENALQLQRQLEHEKELSEMKSRFVFTVSHEFRNPLAAIMSCSDVLQRTREQITPEEHDLQIDGIQQSVRRMADMMEEVLLLGRAEAGRLPCEPEPVDLSVFCLNLADQISSASNGRCPIELSVPPDLPRMMLDPSLLQHILGNLISNAVKYSPPGLSVEVSARPEPGGVVITIQDHGMGVPTVDRPRIFEPFHRGSNAGGTAGTGLGLAIAERCVKAHGGGISCESDAGEGTTFTVRLPCTAETPSS